MCRLSRKSKKIHYVPVETADTIDAVDDSKFGEAATTTLSTVAVAILKFYRACWIMHVDPTNELIY